jgi:hypothetical protein
VISESRDESGAEAAPLLTAAEILALHQTLYGPTRIGESLSAVVVILSAAPGELHELVPALQALPGFVPAVLTANDPRLPVELGRLQLSENFSLRFGAVPATAEFAPLWSLYARQLFGVIALSPAGTFPVAEKAFSAFGTVLISLTPPERAALASGGSKVWRELFNRFLPRFQPGSTPTEAP